MSHKKNFFRTRGEPGLNLFIGGVGATITTAGALEAKWEVGFRPTVTQFSIDSNNNISCRVDSPSKCIFIDGAFYVFSSLTYFIYLGDFLMQTKNTTWNYCTAMFFFYGKNINIRGTSTASRTLRNTIMDICVLYYNNDYLGYSTGEDQVFNIIKTGCDIFCHSDLETSNGGNRDADITYAEDSRAATIHYITDNASVPDAPSDTSYSNVTSSSVDISFSTPSSTNPIYKYEVWNNGTEFLGWITTSGDTFSGLASGTSYNLQLKTADDQYNISGLGNTISFTTL